MHALRKPENRRPIVPGCLTACRNLGNLAAAIPKARLYPRELERPPKAAR